MSASTKEIRDNKLKDAAAHAAELEEIISAAASRLDDNHLHLAARSLGELSDTLSSIAYDE